MASTASSSSGRSLNGRPPVPAGQTGHGQPDQLGLGGRHRWRTPPAGPRRSRLPAHQGREVFGDAHQCAQALATADIPSDGDLSEDNGGIRAAEVARQSGHVPRQVRIDGVLHVASGREHGKFAAGVGQRRTRRGWNRSADDLDVGGCLGFLIMRSYWQRFGESYPRRAAFLGVYPMRSGSSSECPRQIKGSWVSTSHRFPRLGGLSGSERASSNCVCVKPWSEELASTSPCGPEKLAPDRFVFKR